MIDFSKELKSEEWDNKRKSILQRDGFTCCACGAFGKTLNVNHLSYEKGKEYWDYPDSNFVTLCKDCHKKVHGYKEGVLKKSLSELKEMAKVEKAKHIPIQEVKIDTLKGKEVVFINGKPYKIYTFAMKHRSRVYGITIKYKKDFRVASMGAIKKNDKFKQEIMDLISMGVVIDFRYPYFICKDLFQ